jgi:hypothetical protein
MGAIVTTGTYTDSGFYRKPGQLAASANPRSCLLVLVETARTHHNGFPYSITEGLIDNENNILRGAGFNPLSGS